MKQVRLVLRDGTITDATLLGIAFDMYRILTPTGALQHLRIEEVLSLTDL